SRPPPLTARTHVRAALAHLEIADRRPARSTGLARPAVDAEDVLVAAGIARGRAIERVEARALALDRLAEHGADRCVQPARLLGRHSVGARERVQAGEEQRLVRVDVAEAREE